MRKTKRPSVGSTTVLIWCVLSVSHTVAQEVDASIQQGFLDGDQQMVGQHAEKYVRLHASLFVVKDRPLPQGRLESPKRCFGPRQQSVDPPSLIRAQRSEEHTSELQPLRHLVCRLLLEKNTSH